MHYNTSSQGYTQGQGEVHSAGTYYDPVRDV